MCAGDGTQEPVVVAGDKLDSFHELKKIGEGYSIGNSVQDAEKDLLTKLWALQETGCTALGPALLLAILIAVRILLFYCVRAIHSFHYRVLSQPARSFYVQTDSQILYV